MADPVPLLDTAKPLATKPRSAPQQALLKLGLVRDIDLALHLPMRYEDETRIVPIASLHDGEVAQVQGIVRACEVDERRRRQLVVLVHDTSGELRLRFLNFYASQLKTYAVGRSLRIRGEARSGLFGREMVHPTCKLVDEATALPQSLTPVYPSTAALPQAYLRKVVTSAMARAPLHELLPTDWMPPGLPTLHAALRLLHQPPPDIDAEALEAREHPAWQRLKFDELLAQQLAQAEAQRVRAGLRAPELTGKRSGGLATQLRAALPFALTAAQERVVTEITRDLARAQPMHRLLQGDVGSGKTVVAALAATVTMDSGWQCALMAPTEILAEQHFRKLISWLEPLGVTVAWLSGSRKGRGRAKMLALVASGQAQLVVGTHAVIQDDVQFARLALAVVDEQHRFGVVQRLALRAKLGARSMDGAKPGAQSGPPLEPHLLMMSATPIPRTLAMAYFADLDVSTIDELPPGRTPVLTKIFVDSKRDAVIARIRIELAQGRQVYWVCPLVEESEHVDLQNATATHALLSAALPGVNVGLVHGRMKAAEKSTVMAQFTQGEMALLVATTVIEVGVDVANASLMVIEHAERFGLAQLHQLRGRVGRGAAASVCVLMYTAPLSITGKARLRAMIETGDGFEIARRDLAIRGPGEFLGARQSGDALLRFADLQEDDALLRAARVLAPRVWAENPQAARAQIERFLGGKAEFMKA